MIFAHSSTVEVPLELSPEAIARREKLEEYAFSLGMAVHKLLSAYPFERNRIAPDSLLGFDAVNGSLALIRDFAEDARFSGASELDLYWKLADFCTQFPRLAKAEPRKLLGIELKPRKSKDDQSGWTTSLLIMGLAKMGLSIESQQAMDKLPGVAVEDLSALKVEDYLWVNPEYLDELRTF